MKSNILRTARVAALGLLCLLPVAAQPPGGPRGFGGPGGERGPEFLAGYLNLTEAQKAQVKQIFDAAKSQTEALQGEMQAARENLNAAVKAQKTDSELTQLGARLGEVMGRGAGIQAQSQKRLRAILTPEQLQKLDTMEGRRGGPHHGA